MTFVSKYTFKILSNKFVFNYDLILIIQEYEI